MEKNRRSKTKIISLRLENESIEALDKICGEMKMSRSKWFEHQIKKGLESIAIIADSQEIQEKIENGWIVWDSKKLSWVSKKIGGK